MRHTWKVSQRAGGAEARAQRHEQAATSAISVPSAMVASVGLPMAAVTLVMIRIMACAAAEPRTRVKTIWLIGVNMANNASVTLTARM